MYFVSIHFLFIHKKKLANCVILVYKLSIKNLASYVIYKQIGCGCYKAQYTTGSWAQLHHSSAIAKPLDFLSHMFNNVPYPPQRFLCTVKINPMGKMIVPLLY